MYPVGSLYFSTDSTSPATIYGGLWERYGGQQNCYQSCGC